MTSNQGGKQQQSSNPLAQARRGKLIKGGSKKHNRSKDSITSVTASTADSAKTETAKDIWFRKTGTGLACFVAYYAHVILSDDNAALTVNGEGGNRGSSDGIRTLDSAATSAPKRASAATTGPGLSRAALKRRKRQKTSAKVDDNATVDNKRTAVAGLSCSTTNSENNDDDKHQAKTPEAIPTSHNTSIVKDHPLWKAFEKLASSKRLGGATATSAVTSGDSMHALMAALTRPLPLTFRIRQTAAADDVSLLRQELEAYNTSVGTSSDDQESSVIYKCGGTFVHDQERDGPEPPAMALAVLDRYQAACSKAALPNDVKELLFHASQNGVIARQELGSMLPVAALVQVGALSSNTASVVAVLDMCASPGSKTLQALEVLLHSQQSTSRPTLTASSKSSTKPKFLLVANDILQSRLDALQQAVERSGMPQTQSNESNNGGITYTCQDATKFALRVASKVKSSRGNNNSSSGSGTEPLLFDAILCDVPCSGDGTTRKDRHILTRWTPAIGNQLHATQLALLSRALQLLKPGGVVCYSTSSMNPVENEAVVAAAIAKYNKSTVTAASSSVAAKAPSNRRSMDGKDEIKSSSGRVELVECPAVPGVILRNGLSTWSVAEHNVNCTSDDFDDEDDLDATKSLGSDALDGMATTSLSSNSRELLTWYATFDDANQGGVALKRSMWPPDNSTAPEDEADLSRCKRLWPQDQDSGGFFLALIRKMHS